MMRQLRNGTVLVLLCGMLMVWFIAEQLKCDSTQLQLSAPLHDDTRRQKEFDRKVKDIIHNFEKSITADIQHSCLPYLMNYGDRNGSGSHLGLYGNIDLMDSEQETSISTISEVASEFPNSDRIVFAQLGNHFVESLVDRTSVRMATLLLKSLRIKVLSLANNGAMGKSPDLLNSLLQHLHANQIEGVGLKAKPFVLLDVGGLQVGVVAYCTFYTNCKQKSLASLIPSVYSHQLANDHISQMKKVGADVIVVLMYWGNPYHLYPSEYEISVARQLSLLNISLIVGDYPKVPQNHAYFQKTLVIFSTGTLFKSQDDTCWNQMDEYREEIIECRAVPPQQRETLKVVERTVRLYHLTLLKNGYVVGDYKTLPLLPMKGVLKASRSASSRWLPICSGQDTACLSCKAL